MAENKLKERWKAGKAAVNGWLAIPSGFSAEVMAQWGDRPRVLTRRHPSR
jgi:2-keto-3-deoxy-L-rhamnonate aldolase RhmA